MHTLYPEPSIKMRTNIKVSGLEYEIGEKCGDGLFAEVYKAKSRRTDQNVAIKIMHFDASLRSANNTIIDIAQRRNGFKTEAKCLIKMNKAHRVVKMLDCDIVAERPVIVEKLLDQKYDLKHLSRDLRDDVEQGFHLATQLCAMLAYAHDNSILYSDFKKDHIFWKWDGKVKQGHFIMIDWNSSIIGCHRSQLYGDFERLSSFGLILDLFSEDIRYILSNTARLPAWEVLLKLREFGETNKFHAPKNIPSKAYLQLRVALQKRFGK